MAASAFDVARWVIPYWRGVTDETIAVTVGMARGADVNAAGGVFGQGGPAGDGKGQAAAAYAVFQEKGWKAFPERSSGQAALRWPQAAAAVAAAHATDTAGDVASDVGGAAGGAVSTATDTATGIGELAGESVALMRFLTDPNTVIRGVKILIGGALLIVGAVMIQTGKVTLPIAEKGLNALATARFALPARSAPASEPAAEPSPAPASAPPALRPRPLFPPDTPTQRAKLAAAEDRMRESLRPPKRVRPSRRKATVGEAS